MSKRTLLYMYEKLIIIILIGVSWKQPDSSVRSTRNAAS